MIHTLKWFENRIGKRIYRNKVSCICIDCQYVEEHGLVVGGRVHARALCEAQAEGRKYRDKK